MEQTYVTVAVYINYDMHYAAVFLCMFELFGQTGLPISGSRRLGEEKQLTVAKITLSLNVYLQSSEKSYLEQKNMWS